MSLSKVLVAYDGSDSSKKAIATALDIIRTDASIQLDIVNIVAIPDLTGGQVENFAPILEMMKADAEELLKEAMAQVDEDPAENPVNTLLFKGVDPATEIAKLFNQEDYDILVVGSRGLSGLKEYMGSISHKLLGICKKPVLVVK